MWRKFKLPVVILVIVLLNQVVGYAVKAAMPETLLPAGTTRYAVTSSGAPLLTFSNVFTNVSGASTYIGIPVGKLGDVFVTFCAEAYSGTVSALQVRAIIGGAVAIPTETNFYEAQLIANQCAPFYRLNLGAGTHNVRIQWRATNGFADLYDRTMTVITNIH